MSDSSLPPNKSQGFLQHQVLDYLKKYGRKYCHLLHTRFSLRSDAPIGPAIIELQEGGHIEVTDADGLMVGEITPAGLKRLEENTY